MNRGAWLKIETLERKLVRQHNNVWVICGGLYEKDIGQIKDEDGDQPIPSACWKVIAIESKGVKLAAFIMPQKIERKAKPEQFQVTVAEVEKRTGLNLFPRLKDAFLETKKSDWWQTAD